MKKDIGNYILNSDGRVFSKLSNRFLKPTIVKGYCYVDLGPNTKVVHRLIANAFIENPVGKPTVNHKNGIKTDNRVENLEWCTIKENIHHAFDNNLRPPMGKGENCISSKLKLKQVQDIRYLHKHHGFSQRKLGRLFGVTHSTIGTILRNETWS